MSKAPATVPAVVPVAAVPAPLPLSQTETGALATAPLTSVVNAATNALYEDLHNLVHGEIKIVSVAANLNNAALGEAGVAATAGSSGIIAGANEAGNHNNAIASSVEDKLIAAALGADGSTTAASASASAPAASASASALATTPTYTATNNPGTATNNNNTANSNDLLETRKERMANLSFAQRRHELTHRIVRNTKSLSHVYALTAASLPKSYASLIAKQKAQVRGFSTRSTHTASGNNTAAPPPPRLGASVQLSSDALQFVRSNWVSQDEAQDALYFHHDGLWKARAHCHDVLGALGVLSTRVPGEGETHTMRMTDNDGGKTINNEKQQQQQQQKKEDDDEEMMDAEQTIDSSSNAILTSSSTRTGGGGRWPDFPTSVALAVDRYEISKEKSYSPSELQKRLAYAVRRKLVLGEVGMFGTTAKTTTATTAPSPTTTTKTTTTTTAIMQQTATATTNATRLPWRVVLEKGGGSIRLTYGTPRTVSTAEALRQRSLADSSSSSNHNDSTNNDNNNINNSLQQYPMEARLSVLSEHASAPWKLLSLHVRCLPKTGESDHQLGMNRKQMFDLHRIGERAMIVEEAICRKLEEEKEKEIDDGAAIITATTATATLAYDADADDANMEIDNGQAKSDTNTSASLNNNKQSMPPPMAIVPRPLHRLFEVTHAFALSLQLEMLSSQAEALRRGAWGGVVFSTSVSTSGGGGGGGSSNRVGGAATKETLGDGIAVSPAYFFNGEITAKSNSDDNHPAPIAVMAVHFWSCDDRYGYPKVGDLSTRGGGEMMDVKGSGNEEVAASVPSSSARNKMAPKGTNLGQRQDDNFLPKSDRRGDKRLSLCIRAVPMVGLVVSLSGGSEVASSLLKSPASPNEEDGDDMKLQTSSLEHSHHVQRNVDKLLSSIQDPFQLSMSDALLAATVLCAERRCHAVVAALNNQKANKLPSWIHLEVECGSISVAACISYPSAQAKTPPSSSAPSSSRQTACILFRLACDSRTGRFVPLFPRPATLLRLLACNDVTASEVQSMRTAAMASALRARSNGRGSTTGGKGGGGVDGATREFTGRAVRDAFDALSRSMDTLGRRCGVGGDWNDIDGKSISLRERSVDQACRDVRVSLMTCSGMAAVFGMAAIALRIAGGVDPVADMAGGPIDDPTNADLIRIPPLGVLLRQSIVEQEVNEGGDEPKRVSCLQGELLAVTAKTSNESLDLVCYDVLTMVESAHSAPKRVKLAPALPPESFQITEDDIRPFKIPRISKTKSPRSHRTLDEVEHAALWFDSILCQ